MMTFYDVLDVPNSATQEQITKAFRTRARLLHPDRHTNEPEEQRDAATRAMQLLTEAYYTLRDAGRRAEYDQKLRDQEGPGFGRAPRNSAPKPPPAPTPDPSPASDQPNSRGRNFKRASNPEEGYTGGFSSNTPRETPSATHMVHHFSDRSSALDRAIESTPPEASSLASQANWVAGVLLGVALRDVPAEERPPNAQGYVEWFAGQVPNYIIAAATLVDEALTPVEALATLTHQALTLTLDEMRRKTGSDRSARTALNLLESCVAGAQELLRAPIRLELQAKLSGWKGRNGKGFNPPSTFTIWKERLRSK